MRAAAPTLTTTIAELRCISPDAPAVLHELRALAIAQQGIEQLLRECVGQLRENPGDAASWAEIADALGSTPDAVRMKFKPSSRERYTSRPIPESSTA